jgi:3-(methylsulfanyl)propanoyl-CoA dehydrogenase
MLLSMRAQTRAARAICYATAVAIDRAHLDADEDSRQASYERASLLTPVAKAFATDVGVEVSSLGVQVHGGMGYIEETGAAQHYRDSRIAAIYEGTNGIQAIDLVMRKIPLAQGATVKTHIADLRRTVEMVRAANNPAFGATGARLAEALDSLERTTAWLLGRPLDDASLAGATPYLRLFATATGGALLAEEALAAARAGTDAEARIAIARFFAEHLAPASSGLEREVVEGADSVSEVALA